MQQIDAKVMVQEVTLLPEQADLGLEKSNRLFW
jgi:hypothetical protein